MDTNLQGIRVVELTHWVAGPLAGQILGEWGADVIHVERKGSGDVSRSIAPFYKGKSLYYRAFNRDKRSLSLDVTAEAGRKLLFRLLKEADVFITNYSTEFLEKHGLTWEIVHRECPRLIACYITGFGLTGPLSRKKSLDMVMQAMSGQMACTGEPDGIPYKTGTITADYSGAYQAVIGILTALLGRQRTGEGRLIDVGITDVMISALEWRIPEYRLTGKTTLRTGNRRPSTHPNNLYRAADGYLYIAASNQKMYERLCEVIGDPRMKEPRFAENPGRVANADALDAIIAEWTGGRSREELLGLLEQAGLPCGPLNTPADLAEGSYVDEKQLVMPLYDEELQETIPYMNTAIKMDAGARECHRAAPPLGADTDEVLKEVLSLSEEEISELKRQGAVE